MLRRSIPVFLSALSLFVSSHASASISLSATRIVFDSAHKEANITVRNGNSDVLIQSWLDRDDTDATPVPFAVTPPLTRVSAKDQQLLRILYEGAGMPNDKESVVWLNVQEIPQASATGANTLQLAVRQRIKVFFRPAGLKGEAGLAPTELAWKLENKSGKTVLTVKNPTLYHVSMADIKLETPQNSEIVVDSTMIIPGGEREFPVKKFTTGSAPTLSFSNINDYGAQNAFSTQLVNGRENKASSVKTQSTR